MWVQNETFRCQKTYNLKGQHYKGAAIHDFFSYVSNIVHNYEVRKSTVAPPHCCPLIPLCLDATVPSFFLRRPVLKWTMKN